MKTINHPKNAALNELMEKPGSIHATKASMHAFNMSRNNPKERIVTGNVRMNNIGRIIAFTIPSRNAAMSKVSKLST
jgi:hypothetical protein